MKDFGIFVGSIITVFAILIIAVPLYALLGWVIGWILSWTIGELVCSGINVLFSQTIAPYQLPVIFASLGAIGSMFKSSASNDKKG